MTSARNANTHPEYIREQLVARIPAHPPRKATAAYRRAHRKLVVTEDRPCAICGVRNSDLNDPQRRNDPTINPHGATKIETHHRIVEWSLANAIDLDKFNARIVAAYRRMGIAGYDTDFSQSEMLDWIDHSELNLECLCNECHRSPTRGIHYVPGPLFGPQDLLLPGYVLLPDDVPVVNNGRT